MNNYSMLVICLFPMISGIIGFYLGKKRKQTRNDWIDIAMFVELAMLACMGYQIATDWSTLSMTVGDVSGFGLFFVMDEVRLVLCMVIAIVFTVVSCFMKETMKDEKGSNRFYLLYMCMYSMVSGAVMTNNMFNFFFFVTAALLLAYPMIMHRRDEMAIKNAGIFLIFTVITIALFILSCVLILRYVGTIGYEEMFASAVLNGTSAGAITGGLVAYLVFAVYAGMFPLQFQVTRGCSYGLIEISVILSSVISKLGVFGMMMLASTIFSNSSTYGYTLIVMAILATVWGLLITFTSTDIRKILMGLDVAINGFNALGVSLMVHANEANTYAVRGSFYMMVMSSLSLMMLYMVALKQVRKVKKFEINGLIASGKDNKLLLVACFIACINLAGVPGTAGYLAFSMIFRTIITNVGWKWLVVTFVIMWAFFITAVTRVFMKLFVSKKDEAIRILSTEEEFQGNIGGNVQSDPENVKSPYFFAEVLLLLVGATQVVVGVVPDVTVEWLSDKLDAFFFSSEVLKNVSYYTAEGIAGFVVAALLSLIIYLNLVHGILLRAIRNKKNRELKKKME